MSISGRPHTKLATALLTTGLVVAGATVDVPAQRGVSHSSTAVAPASVVTDVLYGLGDAVSGLSNSIAIPLDAGISLPWDALLAIGAAAENPELGPNIVSWLVQRYANPSDSYPLFTYPWAFRVDAVGTLAQLLPFPLGPGAAGAGVIIDAADDLAHAIGEALSGLPDAELGEAALLGFLDATTLGRTIFAVQRALIAPLFLVFDTVNYLGYLPAELAATIESALRFPDEIPGLLSNLVYGLASPDPEVGLVGSLLESIVTPLAYLPPPIGISAGSNGWALEISTAIVTHLNAVLASLPTPIAPTPVPPAAVAPEVAAEVAAADVASHRPAVQADDADDVPTQTTDQPPTPDDVAPTTPDAPESDAGVTDPESDVGQDGAVEDDMTAPQSAEARSDEIQSGEAQSDEAQSDDDSTPTADQSSNTSASDPDSAPADSDKSEG